MSSFIKTLSAIPSKAVVHKLLADRTVLFILKFAILFGLLYSINYAIIALSIPGGYYSEWVANNLRYADFLRKELVQASAWVLQECGYNNLYDAASVRIPGVITVRVAYACMGFGLVSFCWAFVAAYPQSLRKKLIYLLAGTVVIIILNILRIAGLAMIHATGVVDFYAIDHHAIFNIIVYIFLFLFIVKMMNGRKPRATAGKHTDG